MVTNLAMDVDVDVHCTLWTHVPLMHEALFSVGHSATATEKTAHRKDAPTQLRGLSDRRALDLIQSGLETPRRVLLGVAKKIYLVASRLRRGRPWSGRGHRTMTSPAIADGSIGLQVTSSLAVELLNLFCDIRLVTGTSPMPLED